MTRIRARSSQQRGQALVAVIVLIALLFLIGTAMTLAVSSSLHTVRQTADDDWRGYAAESAASLDLASASEVSPTPGCSGPSSLGSSVNGFALNAMRCSPVANISGAGIQRDAVAAQRVASSNCAEPAVGIKVDAGRSAWGTIAWLPSVPDPDIRVLWNDDAACPTWGWGWAGCAVAKSAGLLYFSCDGRFDNDGDGADPPVAHTLHVLVWGPRAVQLSAFYIRSASTGTDCVVTSIGIAGGAVSERDLVRPACGAPSATSAAFWNRLLP